MVTTFQGFAVVLFSLFPGAAYIFSLERQVGSFGVSAADRLVRFFAASAFFLALYSGPAEALYRHFVTSGTLSHADVPWWTIEMTAVTYVVIPALAGTLVGAGRNRGFRLATWFGGTAPEPRAWDWLWRQVEQPAVIRLRLKSGTWLAGIYGTTSSGKAYASGYPEPGDLCLRPSLEVNTTTGELVRQVDGQPTPVPGSPGILLRWDEVEYLEFLS